MLKFIKNLFNDTSKNLVAFELGLVISKVARERGIAVTPKMVNTAEEIIKKEFKTKTATEIAGEFELLTLSVFDTE